VVSMAASMLHAPPDAVGTMTTGGTESILMAVKAARDRARRRRPWIRTPELVGPRTLHVAFEKAAHYFDVRIRYAEIGADMRADVEHVRSLVSRNTVLIAASAPQYPHGVVDPIEEIGAIAARKRIPFHVDACIGGFVLPFAERLGRPIPPFDFRIPAVTSMSADVHKYGLSSKGASVVIYRDMSYLRHQFFIATDWAGGIYASPTMTGTRAGGPIAAAWASLMALGEEGLIDHARRALDAADALQKAIADVPELEVIGAPPATIVAFGSRDPSVDNYAVADQLEDRGWSVDRQQRPPCIHCTLTSNHVAVIDRYADDLRAAVAAVKSNPALKSRGNAAMYGMIAKVPVRALVRREVGKVLERLYGTEIEPPDPKAIGQADDGVVGKLLAKHGPTLDAFLDAIDRVRNARKKKNGR
jgi:sphinganine-1-phosphate aldolase